MKHSQNVPLWEKYTLTVEEATAYFRIGEHKLHSLINENKNADYFLWNGNRVQIDSIVWSADTMIFTGCRCQTLLLMYGATPIAPIWQNRE